MKLLFRRLVLAIAMSVAPAAFAQVPQSFEQVLNKWNELCIQYYEQRQYTQALPACQRVVDAIEPQFPEHPTFALALEHLARVYDATGNYAKAEPLFLHSLRIREKALGTEHLDVAMSLFNLARLYESQGSYTHAETLSLRSLRIREKALGPEHLDVATSLSNLAIVYHHQGRYTQAEPLFLRSLRISEKELGPEHPDVATSLSNLAALYQLKGNYAQAEPLFRRSLRIRVKALGPEHQSVANVLNNLAGLYMAMGLYDQAKDCFMRALGIQSRLQGSEHPAVALIFNNLATLYEAIGNYAQAELLYLHSLKILEKALGPEHPDVATTLNNLAGVYRKQGQYAKAEPQALRILRIREKVLGPEHPDVGESLNSLAELYYDQGDYARAAPLLLRGLQIQEKLLGPAHPIIAPELNNLAVLDVARGQIALALPRFARAFSIQEQTLRSAATEPRITALLDKIRGQEELVYSLLLRKDMPPEVPALALRVSLLRKGRAQEAGIMTGWAIQTSLTTDEQRQRFATWQTARAQRETLFLKGSRKQDDQTRKGHEDLLSVLNQQVDDMEQELARNAPQLAEWKLPVPEQIVAQVAARLTPHSALVEVLWITPFKFEFRGKEDRWDAPRYIALILFPDQRIEFVDLGDSAGIDRTVGELLAAVRNTSREPLPQAQMLYQKVMLPLLSKLSGAQKIYLSLDGSLNLVPFAALHDGQRYLIDAPYQIQYLSAGRDLLRNGIVQPEQPALVLADPDFGTRLTEAARQDSRTVDVATQSLYDGLSGLTQLAGARAEGKMVGGLLHRPPLLGAEATEARLRQVRSPWLLHIATHGLIVTTAQVSNPGARALVPIQPSIQASDSITGLTGKSGSRSLSNSALVLAGAAHAANAPDSTNDGLLTAEEVRSINLFGTQLVVLSACDTGRGTVSAGQGVYGLRRAFLAAGAEAVVMSLWPVSDAETQALMQRYYQLLLDRKRPRSRISSLTEAMQSVRTKRPHPYYWAPFIANGLDAPLRQPPATPKSNP